MSNEQPHDPTITLRLELGRVTDQRDAFKAALNTEVLKVVRVAIIQATINADNEIARLKAEVERLTKAGDAMAKTIGENGVHDNGSFLDVADSIDAWYKAKGVVS